MSCFQMQAALMMQRIDMTRPNWRSFQLWKVLSNMAMPVADSARGEGVWPKTTTFHRSGGVRVEGREGHPEDVTEPLWGLGPLEPDEDAGVGLGLDDGLEQRQPRRAAALEQFGQRQRVVGGGSRWGWFLLLALGGLLGHGSHLQGERGAGLGFE